jgi:hypothetical protein
MSNHLFKTLKGSFFDLYPEEVQQSSDKDFKSMSDLIDLLKNELVNRYQGRDLDLTIEDLDSIYIPERSPSKTLEYLAYMCNYDFDRSKSLTVLRQAIFEQNKLNRRTGTVSFLLDRVEDITGIRPEFITNITASYIGWDQNSTIDGFPEVVDFFGGVNWDQNQAFTTVYTMEEFKWYVKQELMFLDIKNNGVFDLDPTKNTRILNTIYATVARFKDAGIPIKVGYVDSGTGAKVVLNYVFSRDIISATDVLPTGYIYNQDQGIEY